MNLKIAARPSGDDYLVIHLGMSGRLVLGRRPAHESGIHEHVEFATDDGSVFRFSDPRRFGLMDLVRVSQFETDPRFAPLGPEPLAPEFTGDGARRGAQGPRHVDQGSTARSARSSPASAISMRARRCSWPAFRRAAAPARCRAIAARASSTAIKDVLSRAIAAGGSSARDYVQASGEAGWFQHAWAVYDREGKSCPGCDCGRSVKRIVQGGRSTFYCAKRQR